MNPATALAAVLTDELLRCGLREAVVAPGSRSAPLAMALYEAAVTGRAAGPGGGLRLHVRADERSAAFLALGLAKASAAPVAVVCTSGTAAAHFHAAVIEADESCVPLLVLTADRPPELRGTGANQTIDQVKLYGGAVRWFCEAGVPEDGAAQAGYWRSLACRAHALASGAAGGAPGPVHLNLAFRDPLVPGPGEAAGPAALAAAGTLRAGLAGRADGAPWTRVGGTGGAAGAGAVAGAGTVELPWTPRGAVVCGDGVRDAGPLVELAELAGWPLLAEPSSGARRGPAAVPGYPYLLESGRFLDGHRPEVIVSAGRAGLARGQLALLRQPAARHVVLAQGAGRWADPARSATDVAGAITLAAAPPPGTPSPWLESWHAAGSACQDAADKVLDEGGPLTEPRLARDLAALLPAGALLWAASSLPARNLDRHARPRDGLAILASRGTSGIDGLVSSAAGAALAWQRAG
ncbi:MAG TPA: 2-succinyl-5-enolpyruvyl-6-hydroxy-3-cyclohexene-1-carboxylic-acid synthase, partial [Streptosporangiaceae bacterium]